MGARRGRGVSRGLTRDKILEAAKLIVADRGGAHFRMLLVHLDPTRRVAVVLPPVVLTGMGAGPFLSSFFAQRLDVSPIYRLAAAALVVCAMLHLTRFAAAKP